MRKTVHSVTTETGSVEKHLIPEREEDQHTIERWCKCGPYSNGLTVDFEIVFIHKSLYQDGERH